MAVRAEFVGGPKDGEVVDLHAAVWQLHVHEQPSLLTQDGGDTYLSSHYHCYTLRATSQLGQSEGYACYDYAGRRGGQP